MTWFVTETICDWDNDLCSDVITGYCSPIQEFYFVGYNATYNRSESASNGKLPLNTRATVRCRSNLQLVGNSSVTCHLHQSQFPTWLPLPSPSCQGNLTEQFLRIIVT